jgi:HK97 family phage portal protein
VGVFSVRERAAATGPQEQRVAQLAFVAPPIGAHINAVQELWGSPGSPEQSRYHATLWACQDLIASMMSMIQPWAFQLPGSGIPTPNPGPGVGLSDEVPEKLRVQPRILNEPAAGADIGDWLYSATLALMRGNVYGSVVSRDRMAIPTQVELQDNDKVQVTKERDGSVTYRYNGTVQKDLSSVWHRTMFRLPGHVTGMSLMQYSQRAVRLGLNAEDFASGFFTDGAHPSSILLNDSTAPMSQGDATTVKQKFMAAVHGSREPALLTGGWKYQQIQVNPTDSQFVETEQQVDLKVCRYHRVFPELVAAAIQGSSITYANVEQRGLDFLTYCLQRWITWWERKLGSMLAPGQYVQFDLSPLLRTDILTRWQVNHAQIASRAVAPSEVRQGEHMPPLTPEQVAEIAATAAMAPMPKLSQGL